MPQQMLMRALLGLKHVWLPRPGAVPLLQPVRSDGTARSCACLTRGRAVQMSEGRVVAVGPGRRSLNGDVIPVSVKAGDTVLLPEFGGTTVKLDSSSECAPGCNSHAQLECTCGVQRKQSPFRV